MKLPGRVRYRKCLCSLLLLISFSPRSLAQADLASERAFAQSKNSIEQVVNKLQPSLAGRLPVLDGFVAPSDHPLDRYRRAYFQSTVQVRATSSGNSVVRVTTKITAWYADPAGSESGYRLLKSNGRLEADLLDQLSDELADNTTLVPATKPPGPTEPPQRAAEPPTQVQTPARPAPGSPFSSSLGPSLPTRDQVPPPTKNADKDLQTEIKSLEEILRNQAQPNNLVAVKQSGTAVVATPSLAAKTLFLASAHDEFEMLDFNSDWVHVRISGLSRGWIWRNSLEMPEGIPDTAIRGGSGPTAAAAQLFHVTREETAAFPGDWQPLRGKSVKIVSIEKSEGASADTGLTMRLEFAKSLLDKNYSDLAQKADTIAGIVLIFDSSDGGMIAATTPVMRQWKAGELSDSAFWRQCFFDPPEMLGATGSSATQ